MSRFLSKDFLAGLMFLGFGLLTYVVAFTNWSSFFGQTRLALGTPIRMGPGYVPQMLSFIMMTLGTVIALWAIRDIIAIGALKLARLAVRADNGRARIDRYIEAVRTGVEAPEPVEGLKLRPILMITLGVLVFGLLLESTSLPGAVSWFVPGLPRWENPVSGLIPALVGLVFLAALGGDEFHFVETIGMCVVLSILCMLIFKCGLSMNIGVFTVFPTLGDPLCVVVRASPILSGAVIIALTAAAVQLYRRRQRSTGLRRRDDTSRGAV